MSARGSVYSWCGYRDPATSAAGKPLPAARKAGLDGHRRRIRRGGFRTRKAAEKALARLRMPADPESVLTTREWLEQWREQRTG
jgi:hypothetical protein